MADFREASGGLRRLPDETRSPWAYFGRCKGVWPKASQGRESGDKWIGMRRFQGPCQRDSPPFRGLPVGISALQTDQKRGARKRTSPSNLFWKTNVGPLPPNGCVRFILLFVVPSSVRWLALFIWLRPFHQGNGCRNDFTLLGIGMLVTLPSTNMKPD